MQGKKNSLKATRVSKGGKKKTNPTKQNNKPQKNKKKPQTKHQTEKPHPDSNGSFTSVLQYIIFFWSMARLPPQRRNNAVP